MAHTVPDAAVEKDTSVNRVSAMPPIRILLVDDHSVMREGLAALLERDNNMQIVGSAATGEEGVLAAHRLTPDIIIMDLMLPDLNGIDATRRIVSELPRTHIIALSACHTSAHANGALRAGAHGYVLKAAAGAELLIAIKTVIAGQQYVSPAIAALIVDGGPGTSIPTSPLDRLSARERDVLRRIVAGATSAEIARDLTLSRKTVDTYRGRMMVKLGVANRSQLIRCALEYELPVA
jgi:DNA-binding NarL/FixJ family response regulator